MNAIRGLALVMLTVSGVANAEVITQGFIQIVGVFPFGNFLFGGSEFIASGSFSNGNWALTATPWPEGGKASVNGYVVGNDFSSGSASVSGVNYPKVSWGGLNAEGPSIFKITGPDITLDSGPGIYISTFSFSGSLCGTATGTSSLCIANLPSLSGSGTVQVEIAEFTFEPLFSYKQATYSFVPIPSAFWLIGPPLAGFVFFGKRHHLRGT